MRSTTLGDLLDEAVPILRATAQAEARREVEELAARVLGVEPAELDRERVLDGRAVRRLRDLVGRRADGVPLGHLTGRAVFAGLELVVGPGVFVPRVHSELVLAAGRETVAGIAGPTVVDLCAGSGAIGLALAAGRPDAQVHAVEFDPVAVDFARRNAARRAALGDTAVTVHEGEATRAGALTGLDRRVDLVLANPPFMPDAAEVSDEFGRYQPRQAVFGGADGLRVVRQVVEAAAGLLRAGGVLVVEHGHLHGASVPALLRESGCFADVSCRPDHDGWPLYSAAVRTETGDRTS
ncbi:peptide chain release factor N(5)-glutamine methyltransferase [Kitasatospora aureofaciens]|uniref:N5-glutamine methyltransferase family protein n=1 Tax=Kitasatospora aureofaciens TaxID=1894 RepID=UPI001C470E1E|nr:HemK/PrmC family methyltransferase [Kitasatospora aureofaciens]MBV6701534.1 peptide chain release factor N(5)-glutamine methyltransferase [Kitasatospora aureofaciens]